MDSSKFNVWRACFAFCQVDLELAKKEKEWLENKSTSLNFTPDQKTTLLNDLKSPPDINALLPLITKPSDRAFLVDQMRVLAHIDGSKSYAEGKKIEEIKNIVLSKIDLSALEQQIAADEKASYHEDEVFKVDNESSFFERLHRYAQKIDNEGDYVLPTDKKKGL